MIGTWKESSVRRVKAREMASDQIRGIRAGFLEEVLSGSHLEEGIGVSQVKKNREYLRQRE